MSQPRASRPRRTVALAALVLCLLALTGARNAEAQPVRVLLAEGRKAVTVASVGGLTITDPTGLRILAQQAGGAPFHLLLQKNSVMVREARVLAATLLVWPGRTTLLELDGQPFRGRLEVLPVNGGLSVVNVVELEDYLQGVLKDEIPPGWPAEAAMAMAIAARTYAVFQRQQNPSALFYLRATTASQVYGGAGGEDARTSWAVQATRGQILTFGGQPISAFYHSCSGGATENALDVFGLNFDTVVGVKDDFSLNCPYALWVERLTAQQVQRALAQAGYTIGQILQLQVLARSRSGRILSLAVQHTQGRLVLEGKRFREALGNELIRSTDFEVETDVGGFTFVGRGSGHGVGLSQWGAKEMADLAYQHRQILKFYYPLAEIGTIDDPAAQATKR
jgi:stage II sporulation protein D (peptidoglycan lytic transglycosylase)